MPFGTRMEPWTSEPLNLWTPTNELRWQNSCCVIIKKKLQSILLLLLKHIETQTASIRRYLHWPGCVFLYIINDIAWHIGQVEPVVGKKDIHMGERLFRLLFSEISESQSVKADIINFAHFGEISTKRCKGIILGSKSGELSSFHSVLFPFGGEWVSEDIENYQVIGYAVSSTCPRTGFRQLRLVIYNEGLLLCVCFYYIIVSRLYITQLRRTK